MNDVKMGLTPLDARQAGGVAGSVVPDSERSRPCQCVGVTMGGYENQVAVYPPPHMVAYRKRCNPNLSPEICLDRCISEEVQALWEKGITTNGCCCGHNRGAAAPAPYIGVEVEDVPKMEALGYEHIANCPFPEIHFHSKSATWAK